MAADIPTEPPAADSDVEPVSATAPDASAPAPFDEPDEPLVRVRDVSKSFGTTRALAGVSLEVHAGAVAIIAGPNGSGKSTLIRIVSSLMLPTSGDASVCGHSTADHPEAVRSVTGTLLHEPTTYGELTVRENLELFATLCRLEGVRARVADAAATHGLADALDLRTRVLSHGMRKRVSLAMATVHAPRVLLLDEPSSGLDAASIARLEAAVQATIGRGGCAIVSSHSEGFASRIGTHFYRMSDGRLTATDAPGSEGRAS